MSSAKILDGKMLADQILANTADIIYQTHATPGLAAILVGDDPASRQYINLKEKAANKIGVAFHKYLSNSECYSNIDEHELAELIEFLNNDPAINGILVQVPLPSEFNQDKMLKLIRPEKDVDGFNGGKVVPPTVAAIIELLRATGEELNDKRTIIIGKSEIFTGGISKHLTDQLSISKIDIVHDIPDDCNTYDIIIIALGQAGALKKSAVKAGAIVVDVGINKLNGETVGDADPEVAEVAGYLSPVPGGVGPLTVACLMRNVVELALKK